MSNNENSNTEQPQYVYLTASGDKYALGMHLPRISTTEKTRGRRQSEWGNAAQEIKGLNQGRLPARLSMMFGGDRINRKNGDKTQEEEHKNALCDIAIRVSSMTPDNLPLKSLPSTRRYGGPAVEVEDLTAAFCDFGPVKPFPLKRGLTSVSERAQQTIEVAEGFREVALSALAAQSARAFSVHAKETDEIVRALIEAQPLHHFTYAIHLNSKKATQGDPVFGVLIPTAALLVQGLDPADIQDRFTGVGNGGMRWPGFPSEWTHGRKAGHTLFFYLGFHEALVATCKKAVSFLAPVDAFVQHKAAQMSAEIEAREESNLADALVKDDAWPDVEERNLAWSETLRVEAVHRGLPRLKAYLSLLHSEESILLYGEPNKSLVAWLKAHIAFLEENPDLMMEDQDPESMFTNVPNGWDDDATEYTVTRDSHGLVEVAETLAHADDIVRRAAKARAARLDRIEVLRERAADLLAAQEEPSSEIVKAFMDATAAAVDVTKNGVQTWKMDRGVWLGREPTECVGHDDRFAGLGLENKAFQRNEGLVLTFNAKDSEVRVEGDVCIVAVPCTLYGVKEAEETWRGYDIDWEGDKATLTLTFTCSPDDSQHEGTGFFAYGRWWTSLASSWYEATVSDVEIVRAEPQEA